MTDDVDKEIERIVGQMKCPHDFRCYKSGFEKLCKVRDFGIENYLECLEEDPRDCTFVMVIGRLYVCKCPLRYYLVKNHKRDE